MTDQTPTPTPDPNEFPRALTPEEKKARDRRNLAIAGGLVLFVVLVFLITVINLQQGIAERPL